MTKKHAADAPQDEPRAAEKPEQPAVDDAAFAQAADAVRREAVKYRQYQGLAEQLDAIGSLVQAKKEAQHDSEQARVERDALRGEVDDLKAQLEQQRADLERGRAEAQQRAQEADTQQAEQQARVADLQAQEAKALKAIEDLKAKLG